MESARPATNDEDTPLCVVLLPGLDGTGEQFQRLVESAPNAFRTQVVSYPTDEVLDYEQLQDRVRAVLPNEPYLLLGESFSGPIAVAIAAESPAQLKGLILAASFVAPPASPLWRFLPWKLAFQMQTPTTLLRRLLSPRDKSLVQSMQSSIRRVSPAVLAARVRATLRVDRRTELAAVRCPVLYLQAGHDHVVPARCLQQVLALQPNAAVQVLPTAHPILQLAPTEAWAALERFSERVRASS